MLQNLHISNIALIDDLDIDFSPNLNVLSGETGAGKSIIIDSLNFVLGNKTNKSLIKQGCDYMKVTACFCPPFADDVKDFLTSIDVNLDDNLVISRKMTQNSKNDIKINGEICSISMLKTLTSLLVDIHGQHEHQRLLSSKYHSEIIDTFLDCKELFEEYSTNYHALKNINEEIESLNSSTENQERMLDLLDYQIKEIEDAKLQEAEDIELQNKLLIMQNGEKIFDSLNNAYNNLDNSSLLDTIKSSVASLNIAGKYDEDILPLIDRLEATKYELMDIAETIKDKKSNCEFDEYQLNTVEDRLDLIKNLKKKYGPTLEDVFLFLNKSKQEYDRILNSKDILKNKLKEKNEILKILYNLANNLSDERRKVAKQFEKDTRTELDFLGMKNSCFLVKFADKPNFCDAEQCFSSLGFDNIEFMFSANLGQEMKELSSIISGGEASRFMLALKNILAEKDSIDLMVFDEIDTGISGEMGYKVACKLANISKRHQVMSVSHLPQICAMADRNILVTKFVEDNDTKVTTKTLDGKDLLEEIARLSGGDKNSEISLGHAKELKEKCNKYKSTIK